jgi:hypothetical protein
VDGKRGHFNAETGIGPNIFDVQLEGGPKFKLNDKTALKPLLNIGYTTQIGEKNQAVVSIKCKEALIEGVRKTICESSKIVEARVVIAKDEVMMSDGEVDISDLTLDHLEKFVECCKEKIDNSDILDFELAEICR